ncbi:sigma-70 family RNA polymerase sigma factor [Clostridium sp. KNHs216]|uniref:sigma-70 family RNA polymerase sigma factor n=1 Tax=Clostridium sp. KNHs216 TaxID=1550235 RepID=UPI0011523A08|nr:sigma-70 family RNA polymerase sigma factor [Clostridium sp. KNHs216]TQI68972.1 RNA polymerase sigma factor (sigma-70 family) [Clostridium sp. KNHs216]
MKHAVEPLTSKERDFAERNHNLIYSYLVSKRLPYDEWYDIAAYGYILAVKEWHRHPEYPFSRTAYYYMGGQVSHEFDRRSRQKNTANVISYDAAYVDERIESIESGENIESTVEIKCIAECIEKSVPPNRSTLIRLFKAGYNQTEISRILGVSAQRISAQKFKIRKECEKLVV